jgi:hypothetical protein
MFSIFSLESGILCLECIMGRYTLLAVNHTTIQKADIFQKQQRLYTRIAKFNQMAQLFMSGLNIDVTFSHQDDSDFCPEKKKENLNNEESERAFWEALADENPEEDEYEDNLYKSFSENLPL